MLLVALHEKNNFELPTERVPEWYGWCADTAERGLATLEQLGLLTHTTRLKKAPLSPTGLTKVNRYLLHEPFGQLTIDDIFNDDVIESARLPRAVQEPPRQSHGGCDREEGRIMTAPAPRTRDTSSPATAAGQARPALARRQHTRGAVLYAVIAGLIVWIVVNVLSHVHVVITWH